MKPRQSAMQPRITIVTPSFNQGQFLEETICSVLEQNYPNLEYIVVDGGSSDNSVEIIRKYQRHLAWWVSEQDGGQSAAINKGLSRATGDLMGYLNSDDLLLVGALNRVEAAFESGAAWATGGRHQIEQGQADRVLQPKRWAKRTEWFFQCLAYQPSTFWRADLFRRLGPFRQDLHCSFDYEYWMRILFAGGESPAIIDESLSALRWHDSSKSSTRWREFDGENEMATMPYLRYLNTREWIGILPSLNKLRARRRWARGLHMAREGRRLMRLRHSVEASCIWPPFACGKFAQRVRRMLGRQAGA